MVVVAVVVSALVSSAVTYTMVRARYEDIERSVERIDHQFVIVSDVTSEKLREAEKSSQGLDARLRLLDFAPNWFCGLVACARDQAGCNFVQSELAKSADAPPETKDKCIPRRVAFCSEFSSVCFRNIEQCKKVKGRDCVGVE